MDMNLEIDIIVDNLLGVIFTERFSTLIMGFPYTRLNEIR